MNTRQKAGLGMLISGILSFGVGLLVTQTGVTPAWVDTGLSILSLVLPSFGLVINLPSNTNPK